MTIKNRFITRLFTPVPSAFLAYFRIVFSSVVLVDFIQYFCRGWIEENYISPVFHFHFVGLPSIQPLPGNWMYILFAGGTGLLVCLILGLWTKISSILFFLIYTYIVFIDPAYFVEWNYLILLLAGFLVVLPVERVGSIDVKFQRCQTLEYVPVWMLFILRFQVGIVYFFGGIGKLNADWIKGDLLSGWLLYGYTIPGIGHIHIDSPAIASFLAAFALFFDLFIAFILLVKRLRPAGLVFMILFHLHNILRFDVGIFPYLMILMTFIFCDPETFTRWVPSSNPKLKLVKLDILPKNWKRAVIGLLIYIFIQVAFPLRHLLYPGNPNWTEEGTRFAWFLYTRHKSSIVHFKLVDHNGTVYYVNKDAVLKVLSPRQYQQMTFYPELIYQFGWYLSESLQKTGIDIKEAYAITRTAMNIHPPQELVDSKSNLLATKLTLGHKRWIVPLGNP